MEVHHHPHLPHGEKKKFKEYFLEFLMIFLAVTLGFFAESLRENIDNHIKAKQYLSSMYEELKYDTAQYRITLNKIDYLNPLLDSCYMNVREANKFHYILVAKWNTPVNETGLHYMPTLAIIEQLKSSGNLRLLENNIVKKITEYETYVKGDFYVQNEECTLAAQKIYNWEDALCDYTDFNAKLDGNLQRTTSRFNQTGSELYNMPIVVKNAEKLNAFANSFVNYKANNYGYIVKLNNAKKIATQLLQLINDNYHFDK